jgi:streptogramin lyase
MAMDTRVDRFRHQGRHAVAAVITVLGVGAAHAAAIDGTVVDAAGKPLAQAMVTLTKATGQQGAAATTVFSDAKGHFAFADGSPAGTLTARLLDYRQTGAAPSVKPGSQAVRVTMKADANQAGIAPASAWLAHADPNDKGQLILTCVSCHQFPAPEVRNYAKLIDQTPHTDAAEARRQSWEALTKYMNYISAWEFGRGGNNMKPDPNEAYSGGDSVITGKLIARTLIGPMQEIKGYKYGAPLLVTPRTVIREFEFPRPNAVREAVTLDDPHTMWVADVSSNRMIRVNTVTGATKDFVIPINRPMGPHTIVRGPDDSLWATSFFHGTVARLEPKTEKWQVWTLDPNNGKAPGVHDLSFGYDQNILTDKKGLIWYSDIGNNGVGWFDPKTGKGGGYPIPPVAGRVGGEQTYGLVMSSDRTHIWYCQLGIGAFGSFNVETRKFETAVKFDDKFAGPRRMTISDDDVLYLALYGSGQLAAYDTKAHKMLGIYDLPDRASAPYSATWDPKRKVVWVATSNADAIYRFNPRDKSMAVLPLPREAGFLRMIQVDRHTGVLTTSYANIVEYSHGPRMALQIEVGDEAGAAR